MAHALICPSCGEAEDLEGRPQDGDIRVVCGVCGAAWMRGGPVCATCGGDDIVERPQSMTRHSRGTQLSIIGWRQLPLCRKCDADALRTSVEENMPVPGPYVSAALHAPQAADASGRPSRTARAKPAPNRRSRSETSVPDRSQTSAGRQQSGAGPGAGETAATSGASRTTPSAAPQQMSALPGRPAAPRHRSVGPATRTGPTVRQAIAAFLAEASADVDNTAMLLLGTHLGSYNRLGTLDRPDAADALADWFAGRWQEPHSEAAQRARATLCRAIDFWGARGRLTSDLAARLR